MSARLIPRRFMQDSSCFYVLTTVVWCAMPIAIFRQLQAAFATAERSWKCRFSPPVESSSFFVRQHVGHDLPLSLHPTSYGWKANIDVFVGAPIAVFLSRQRFAQCKGFFSDEVTL